MPKNQKAATRIADALERANALAEVRLHVAQAQLRVDTRTLQILEEQHEASKEARAGSVQWTMGMIQPLLSALASGDTDKMRLAAESLMKGESPVREMGGFRVEG